MPLQRRSFLARSAAAAGTATFGSNARATLFGNSANDAAVTQWNQVLLDAIVATSTLATISARAISMLNEAIYNAWAAYDRVADFTLPGLYRRSFLEWSGDNKVIALSHAAHTVLSDLFPAQRAAFDALLDAHNRNRWFLNLFAGNARQVGLNAGYQLLQARHGDGSNQRGDLAPGAYGDTSGYVPVNTPDLVVDPTRWQPLRLPTADGGTVVQKFLTPHWGRVRPFALSSGAAFRPSLFPPAPTLAEMNEVINYSATLNDQNKALVDFWAANPGTVSPPGQWIQIAMQVSDGDANSLDEDVRLFFAAGQALLDASIAAWDAKRAADSVRPITAIRYYFRNQTIRAWGGPGLGPQHILGQAWRPFQRPGSITPNFPEFVSGHSTFSASAARVIAGLRRSDTVRLAGAIAARSLRVDPGFPTVTVNFNFNTLSAAADSAGLSRRVGGIHFERGDLSGRALGRQVGDAVLGKCQALFSGRFR